MAELKLHLNCYSGMVQISAQTITSKPHTETFLKLDFEYEKSVCKKKSGELRKQHNYNFYPFYFFMASFIHPCQKRALIPLKFEIFNYDTFFKVAQSYPHGPKLAQLTVCFVSFVEWNHQMISDLGTTLDGGPGPDN